MFWTSVCKRNLPGYWMQSSALLPDLYQLGKTGAISLINKLEVSCIDLQMLIEQHKVAERRENGCV